MAVFAGLFGTLAVRARFHAGKNAPGTAAKSSPALESRAVTMHWETRVPQAPLPGGEGGKISRNDLLPSKTVAQLADELVRRQVRDFHHTAHESSQVSHFNN
jgi:hypothetical protein